MENQSNSNMNGAIMLEACIGLSFLLMMIFMMLDVGMALNQYARLARISYEGSRYASALAGLEDGSLTADLTFRGLENVIVNPTGSDFPTQTKLAQRLQELLKENNFVRDVNDEPPVLITKYVKKDNAAEGTTYPDIISVEVNYTYRPLTPFLVELPLSIKTYGPYLYRDRT